MIPGLLRAFCARSFFLHVLNSCLKFVCHGLAGYENGIDIGDEVVMMTTKGEAIAIGIAQMTTAEVCPQSPAAFVFESAKTSSPHMRRCTVLIMVWLQRSSVSLWRGMCIRDGGVWGRRYAAAMSRAGNNSFVRLSFYGGFFVCRLSRRRRWWLMASWTSMDARRRQHQRSGWTPTRICCVGYVSVFNSVICHSLSLCMRTQHGKLSP